MKNESTSSKNLFEQLENIEVFIKYTVVSGLWFILYFLAIILLKGKENLENTIIYGTNITLYQAFTLSGLVLAFFGFFSIRKYKQVANSVRNFHHNYLLNSYKLNFELMPSFGKNLSQKIINTLLEIYPNLVFSRSLENYIEGYKLKDNSFDLVIKKAINNDIEGSIIIKRFHEKNKLSDSELKKILENIEKNIKNYILRVILVVENGFTNEVIEYIGKFRKFKIDLIINNKKDFKIIYVS